MDVAVEQDRWSVAQFVEVVRDRDLSERPLPWSASEVVGAGESIRLVGEGSRRLLALVLAILAFNAGLVVAWRALVPRIGPREITIGWVVFAMGVPTFFIYAWAVGSSFVLVSDRRIIAVRGRGRPSIQFDIPAGAVNAIVLTRRRVFGIAIHLYAIEMRDGTVKPLGPLKFRRAAV